MTTTELLGRWSQADRALALYGHQLGDEPSFLYGIEPVIFHGSDPGHTECWVSRFCRNPLHPGPCKGWKKKLGQVAPGVLNMIEAERKKKLAEKQAKKAAAAKAAKKAVDQAERGVEVDAHPAAKKKLGAKLAAKVLAEDADAAEAKAKLTQKEMAWHAQKKASQLLAANMAGGNLGTKAAQQKYKRYVQKELLTALKKDAETGATGPDSEYQKTVDKLAKAMALSHAQKFVKDDGASDPDSQSEVSQEIEMAFTEAIKKDAAEQKTQGGDPGHVKALTKMLDGLPGEPGSEEKNQAIAEWTGVPLKKKQPFNEGAGDPAGEQQAGGMTPAQAKKFATGWGKIAQIVGVPKDKWPALKAQAAKIALQGGDPMADPVIQKTLKNAVNALVAKAWQHGHIAWKPEAQEFLAEKYAEEIAAMLAAGQTKPEEGSLLDLANKLKTKKIGPYGHEQAIQEKFPDLPMKPAFKDPGPSKPQGVATPIKTTTGVQDVTPKNDGGAGAGGPGKATKAGNAFGEVYAEIYGNGPDEDGTTPEGHAATVIDELNTTSDFDGDISVNAGVLTAELISQLDGSDSITLQEKAALAEHVKPLIEQAMQTGDAKAAKTMVKTFKSMAAPQVKSLAKAMKQNLDEGAKPSEDGGASSPSPLTAVSTPQQVSKITQGIVNAAMEMDPDQLGPAVQGLNEPGIQKKMADSIDNGSSTPVNEVKKLANTLAKAIVKNKNKQNGGEMSSVEEAALSQKLGEAIAKQVATGTPHPLVQEVANNEPGMLKTVAAGFAAKKPPVNNIGDAQAANDALADPDLDMKLAAGFNGPASGSPAAGGAPAGPVAPPVPDALFKTAGLDPKPYGGLVSQYQLAISQGDAESAAEALEDLSKAMAKGFAQEHLNGYGFFSGDEQELAGDILNKLAKDYLDAITSGADAPGGLAVALPDMVSEIDAQASELASDNGWPPDGPAIGAFKGAKLLMISGALSGNLDLYHSKPPTMKGGKPAGAGGKAAGAPSTPAVAPSADSTTAKAAKAATKTAAKKAPTKKAPSAASVAAAKGQKITPKMHGAQVVVDGPQNVIPGKAPVSAPVAQMGQTIHPPEGIYPISQVIVNGREQEVADYNAAVSAGVQGKEAGNVPRNFSELTGAQRDAVYDYTTNPGYDKLNGFLRPPNPGQASENPGPSGKHSAPAADQVAHIDAAMNESRLTQPITTLRGFRGSERAFGALWTQHRDQSWAGAEFRDLAYGSTSINMGTARGFAGAGGPDAVILRIHMPVGTRAINLVGKGAYGHEAEILLNRGARFRIVADNGYQNGARHLDVEVICDADDCAE